MNGNQGYQDEIDLIKLFFYCVKRWRWIVLSMVVVAVLAGGYKYLSTAKSNQDKQQALAQSEVTDNMENSVIVNPNIERYELAIQNEEATVEQLRSYVEGSVVMKLDATNLQTGVISFYINIPDDKNSTLDVIASNYKSYVTEGRLVQVLEEVDNSISQDDLQNFLKFTDERLNSNSTVLRIKIVAPTGELCERYLEVVENAMVSYSETVEESFGKHDFEVMSTSQTEAVDMELQTYQRNMNASYMEAVKRVQTLQTELETVRTKEGETISVGAAVSLENPVTAAIKFAAIGLLLGAFLSVFVLALFYMMSGKLQSVDIFEQEYSMKLIGQVTEQPEKRVFSFVDQWLNRLSEGAYAAISYEEQMKIVASNVMAELGKHEAVRKVMLAGTVAEKNVQEFCSHMKEDVKDVIFSEYQQIVFSSAALDDMENYDAVLFLEKKGVSDKNLIHQEKELADRRDVRILGTVVL